MKVPLLSLPTTCQQVKQALQDADVCVKLRPDWEKAHYRKGMAQEAAGDENAALEVRPRCKLTSSSHQLDPVLKARLCFNSLKVHSAFSRHCVSN